MKVTDLPYEVLYLVRDIVDFCYPQSLLPVRATCRLLRSIFDKALKCCLQFHLPDPDYTERVNIEEIPFLLVHSSCIGEDQGILTGLYKFLSRLEARDEAVVFWLIRTTEIVIDTDRSPLYNDCRLLLRPLLRIFERWEPTKPVVLKISFNCVYLYSEFSDMIDDSPASILLDARLTLAPRRQDHSLYDYRSMVFRTDRAVKIGRKVTDLSVSVACLGYERPLQVFSEGCQNLQRVSISTFPFGGMVSMLETIFKQSASLKVLEFCAMPFDYSGPPAKLTAPQSLETLMVSDCTFPFRDENQPPILSLPIKTLRIGCVTLLSPLKCKCETNSNLLKWIHLPNLTEVSWAEGKYCCMRQKSHDEWIAHKLTSVEYSLPGRVRGPALSYVTELMEWLNNSLSSAPLKNLSLTYDTMNLSSDCFPLPQGHKSLEFIGVTIQLSTRRYKEKATFSAISNVDIVGLLDIDGQRRLSDKFPRLKTVSLHCKYTYDIFPPYTYAYVTKSIHTLYTVQSGSIQMAHRRRDSQLGLR